MSATKRFPLLLNAKDAAEFCGVHVETFRRWREDGNLDLCLWRDTTGKIWYVRDDLAALPWIRSRYAEKAAR